MGLLHLATKYILMKFLFRIILLHMILSPAAATAQKNNKTKEDFTWKQLTSIPDDFGFAGAFAGVSNGALLVIGGANFPDGGAPWTGSKKVWSDKIYVLDKPTGRWQLAGKLPQPLGYGVSVTWQNKLVCVGGSNAQGHSASVLAISYVDKKIKIEELPKLPSPLANSSGALNGDEVYVAGGLLTPESVTAANVFWSLDLKQCAKWKELETWPGPARMLAVAGVQNGSFFLFSGTGLHQSAGGQVEREYLTDAYKFTAAKKWEKLAALPHAVVAAPTPAYAGKKDHLFIFGGDDGVMAPKAAELKANHPGFSDQILSYNSVNNTWALAGKMATDKKIDAAEHPNNSIWAPVTTTFVLWGNMLVFPNGEVRPAVRTPRITAAEPKF